MPSRRVFLQAAAAASVAPVAARAAGAADSILAPRLDLHAVIVDARFADARAFAARWSAAGVPVRTIEADVTPLWQGELRRVWARRPAGEKPAAIAGLTARPALFLLERLAWDHGLRVAFHAEHGESGLAHVVLRGGAGLRTEDIARAGAAWPEALARALEGLPARAHAAGPTPAGLALHPDDPMDTLASWVIAPVEKA